MSYSNSSLATYTKLSPNNSGLRTHTIDRISPHCVVGQCSIQSLGSWFELRSTRASSNYGIDKDGKIGLFVEEKNRSWCTSSSANDNRAVTIECASDTTDPYAMHDCVYTSLIKLCADICKRNGKTKLLWIPDKDKALNYTPKSDEMLLTVHRWFANKTCVPTYSEVLTRNGWKRIDEVSIGEEIACADIDNLRITFEEVYDKVPIHQHDTYTNNELTATMDHRMVYTTQSKSQYRIEDYKHLLRHNGNVYIPLAGYSDFDGLPMSDAMIRFCVALQADGHYMYDKTVNGEKHYYGIEFHLKKERKISRIKKILEKLKFDWKENHKSDGSVSIRIYNKDGINIVNEYCEKFLHKKRFTWDWLYLSHRQAKIFLEELRLWDGNADADIYTSKETINLDVVNAIAAINGVGSRVIGSNVCFRDNPFITLSKEENGTVRNSRQRDERQTEVTCVSVKTGIFLMRQNGKTFITGNCPGNWLYSRLGSLADQVTKSLGFDAINQKPSTSTATTPVTSKSRPILKLNSPEYNEIKLLQTYLNKFGASLVVDGLFGIKTYLAVREFQKANDLFVDGIVGPNTWDKLDSLVMNGSSKKTVHELAKEVISGKWGNQPDREKRLTAAGYYYPAVQAEVDKLMGKK